MRTVWHAERNVNFYWRVFTAENTVGSDGQVINNNNIVLVRVVYGDATISAEASADQRRPVNWAWPSPLCYMLRHYQGVRGSRWSRWVPPFVATVVLFLAVPPPRSLSTRTPAPGFSDHTPPVRSEA